MKKLWKIMLWIITACAAFGMFYFPIRVLGGQNIMLWTALGIGCMSWVSAVAFATDYMNEKRKKEHLQASDQTDCRCSEN